MDKKYQIFISSTYEDLKEERDQAIKAVLEMGHIPVGMEMFSAADEEQWQLIARQIEATDYYIVIVGHRYGSETAEGISYTEKEFDYAKSCGIPTLGFVIDDKASWPNDRVDSTTKKKRKLDTFKLKVKGKLIHFWNNKEDLHGKISISLIKAMTTSPRIGWTRSDENIGFEVTKELTRLSTENSILRTELGKLKKDKEEQSDKVREVVKIMYGNDRSIQVRHTSKWEEATKYPTNLLNIYLAIAPNLIDENASIDIARNISLDLHGTEYFHIWPVGKNITSSLIADFVALEVLETSKKKHSVNDKENYWSLTKLGKEVMKRARRIQLEDRILTNDNDNGEPANEET
jgi:Domain of unknown function (DUF4062)